MKKTANENKFENELKIPSHRLDLAELIVEKSRQIKQETNPNLIFFFMQKPARSFAAFLVLLLAFFIGFNSAMDPYLQQAEQSSIIDEIYNSNSQIL